MVFRAGLRDPCSRGAGKLWESARAAGECIFALSESRATYIHDIEQLRVVWSLVTAKALYFERKEMGFFI